MLGPALLVLFVFKVYPTLDTVRTSFFEWNGFGEPRQFVGLDNYVNLVLNDEVVRQALWNTVEFFVITTIGVNVIGLLLASILNSAIRAKTFFRVVLFIPVVISPVATALLWNFVLDPYVGIVTPLLQALGLDDLIRPWLGDPSISIIVVSIISIWQSFGLFMIIYLAGLQTISAEITEAAALDGANSRGLMWHILLPLLRPFIATSLVLCIIGGFSVFDLIYVLTGGGPLHSTESVATYMFYQGFVHLSGGYAAAIAILLFATIAVVTIIAQPIRNRDFE
jgi:raffinose/stachyose/melibiose transport system permease protein